MTNVKLSYGIEAGFLRGYVNGKKEAFVSDTPEQISAFIMKHRMKDVILTDIFDNRLIHTRMGFIEICTDKYYLQNFLMPVLVPMQMGESEIIEFVPFITEDES